MCTPLLSQEREFTTYQKEYGREGIINGTMNVNVVKTMLTNFNRKSICVSTVQADQQRG